MNTSTEVIAGVICPFTQVGFQTVGPASSGVHDRIFGPPTRILNLREAGSDGVHPKPTPRFDHQG